MPKFPGFCAQRKKLASGSILHLKFIMAQTVFLCFVPVVTKTLEAVEIFNGNFYNAVFSITCGDYGFVRQAGMMKKFDS
ncbi:MAG TPA: hypothetical protein VK004_03700 [Ignavibacteria bacterium]|nr:hypothetical protein [Ignavibacteria bacterium]